MKFIRLIVHILEICLIVFVISTILIKISGMDFYIVLSGSMNPTIKTGSMVLIDTHKENHEVGDVITYKIEDQLVTHRIVEIKNEMYRTKGDANSTPDFNLITKKQILGNVIFVIPGLGYLISFIQSKQIIIILICLLFAANLFDILSEYIPIKNK